MPEIVRPLVRLVTWTAASLAFGYGVMRPASCSEIEACTVLHDSIPREANGYVSCALGMAIIYEVAGLLATFYGSRDVSALVPEMRNRTGPSLLMALMFTVVFGQHLTMAGSSSPWYAHARPFVEGSFSSNRPIYSVTYLDWLIVVPQLMIAAGFCGLMRPMAEVVGPAIETNIYIIFAWMAFFTRSDFVRCGLIFVTISMYIHASWGMIMWVKRYYVSAPAELPGRHLRPCLSVGLIFTFLVYAVVYLSDITGNISPETTRRILLWFELGSKLLMAMCFVAIRAAEYHSSLTNLLRRLSVSNMGLVSILRGSFDAILPCTIDAGNRCILPCVDAQELAKLGSALGRPVAGCAIADLLLDDEERKRFSTYFDNTIRQADSSESPSDAVLTTGGDWKGQMPSVAQVLHVTMGAVAEGGAPRGIGVVIHLSVVPKSTFSRSVERRVVAALRFEVEGQEDGPGFVEFDSEAAGLAMSEAEEVYEEEGQGKIVASLLDMAKLGMSWLFLQDQESEDGNSEIDAASTVLEAMANSSESTNADLATLARMALKETQVTKSLLGKWTGNISDALGGHNQTIQFDEKGAAVSIDMMDITLHGFYKLSCEREPFQMDIHVTPKDDSLHRPAPIRYIFKVSGHKLVLCGPSGSSNERPLRFEGPGLCIMQPLPSRIKSSATSVGKSSCGSTSVGSKASMPDKVRFGTDESTTTAGCGEVEAASAAGNSEADTIAQMRQCENRQLGQETSQSGGAPKAETSAHLPKVAPAASQAADSQESSEVQGAALGGSKYSDPTELIAKHDEHISHLLATIASLQGQAADPQESSEVQGAAQGGSKYSAPADLTKQHAAVMVAAAAATGALCLLGLSKRKVA